MSTSYIKDEFEDEFPIVITEDMYQRLRKFLIIFEQRENHLEAFNSQLFGVTPVAFTTTDRETFFDIFGVKESQVAKVVDRIPSINKEWKVISNPLNIFQIWLVHRAMTHSRLSKDKTENFIFIVAKTLLYRYYTSLSNHNFPYKADAGIMQQVVESLSRQSDIVMYGSWKGVLEDFAKKVFLDRHGNHYTSLKYANRDDKLLYIISDTQTRIRSRINNIVKAYYEIKDDPRKKIISQNATMTDAEGEVAIVEKKATMDAMLTGVPQAVENINVFLRDVESIRFVVRTIKYIPYPAFKKALETFSAIASLQQKNGSRSSKEMYLPYQGENEFPNLYTLVQDVIRVSYRYSRLKGIPENRKREVLDTAQKVYTSSRIKDDDILSIRERMHTVASTITPSQRDATVSALRTGLLLYLITQSFRFQ